MAMLSGCVSGKGGYEFGAEAIGEVKFKILALENIGKKSQYVGVGEFDHLGVMRRDPSDVIKLGEIYYVFYTRLEKMVGVDREGLAPIWPEGYFGVIWYATSLDGKVWEERGEVLGKGLAGRWDSFGVFTPNVVLGIDGKLYMYYTGVRDGFVNNSQTDVTGIGVALLKVGVDGLVVGGGRLNGGEPVIGVTRGEKYKDGRAKFDSYRVDDAAVVVRDGKYYLYYKGRAEGRGPGKTEMGLVISDRADGGFVRVHKDGRSVQGEGHEVMVFAYGRGVVSVVSNVGRGIYYAADGVNFVKVVGDFVGGLHGLGRIGRI